MKAVLISIQPKWCELIASGKKTVEIRKTRPILETPFKCYIYCTQGKLLYENFPNGTASREIKLATYTYVGQSHALNGKVIGEFVCNRVQNFKVASYGNYYPLDKELQAICLTIRELLDYGKQKPLYGWHISDLKIYDKPKELGEFYVRCGDRKIKCDGCKYKKQDSWFDPPYCEADGYILLTRPPQSWCYVEEL